MADQVLDASSWMRRRSAVLSLDSVYVVAALLLLGLRLLLTPLQPNDFWWHMAMGRLIAQTEAVPTVDSFSFTQAGMPFYNQSWLAQLLFYGLYQAGGLPLLILVQSAVLMLVYGLLLRLCIRRSGRLRLSVAVVLLATLPLSFDNWNVRPQSYAFLCFIGYLIILTEYRLNPANQRAAAAGILAGRLWLLPLLMLLWVNLHGSFVLGGGLIGIVLAGEAFKRLRGRPALSWSAWRQLFGWGVLSAVALLVNPRGPAVLGYVGNLLGSSAVTRLVTEWTPPSTRDLGGMIFFAFVIVATLVLLYARRPPDITDLLLYLVFFWLALGAVRNIVWFGMVATPLLVMQTATLLPAPRRSYGGSPALNALLIGLLLLLYCSGLPWLKGNLWPPKIGALLAPATPVAATDALRADPARPQRLFCDLGYGSYLIWAAPEQKLFADARIELYPYEQWQDYIALSSGYSVDELLTKYRIDGLMLSKKEQVPLVTRARTLPGWQLRFEDEETIYLARR